MPVRPPRPAAPAAALCGLAAALTAFSAAAPAFAQVELEPTPPFEPPQLQPSLLDFLTGRPVSQKMEIAHTPELLQPEFAGAPIDSPKGLAAAIKALEVDVPNRVSAARYLGTLDCVQFPEAKQQLIAMATEDPFEEVRYAAVMSLRVMLARGADNPKRANGWKAAGGCGCRPCVERAEAIEEIEEETEEFQRKAKLKELCPKNPCELVCKTIPGLLGDPEGAAEGPAVRAAERPAARGRPAGLLRGVLRRGDDERAGRDRLRPAGGEPLPGRAERAGPRGRRPGPAAVRVLQAARVRAGTGRT